MSEYSSTNAQVLCSCSHLTTFSCPLVPPIVIPQWKMLTWTNLMAGLITLITLIALITLITLTLMMAHSSNNPAMIMIPLKITLNNPMILTDPLGLIVLSSISFFFSLCGLAAYRHDKVLDKSGIEFTYNLLCNSPPPSSLSDPKTADKPKHRRKQSTMERRLEYSETSGVSVMSAQRWFIKRSAVAFSLMLRKHSWFSIFGRHIASTVGSLDRVCMLYSCVLVSAATSAMFGTYIYTTSHFIHTYIPKHTHTFGDVYLYTLGYLGYYPRYTPDQITLITPLITLIHTVEAEGVVETSGVWLWCCLLSMLLSVVEYRVCFQPSNSRFNKLFLKTAEAVVLRRHPKLLSSDTPSRRHLVFDLV